MDTAKRMQLIRIIEKMEKNPEFSEKLGIRNKSVLKPVKEQGATALKMRFIFTNGANLTMSRSQKN